MLPTLDQRILGIISLLDSLLAWSRGSFDKTNHTAEVQLQHMATDVIAQLDDAIQDKQRRYP